MPSNSFTAEATLTTRLGPAETSGVIRRLPQGAQPAQIEQPRPLTVHVRTGSRLHARMWGAWKDNGPMPLTVQFDLDPTEDGTTVHVRLRSDEGWYAFGLTGMALHAYQRRFERVLAAMTSEGFDRVA